MNNTLSLKEPDNTPANLIAPVIPIWAVTRKNTRQKEPIVMEKMEKKIPLFYTAPIFKSKKHDFL